jgi:O-antigen/teichoic acid export membrane protein
MSRPRWQALRTWLVTRPARGGRSSRFVAVNYSTPGGRRMSFERDWYLPAGTVSFSGGTYPAPGDTDAVLTELYGPTYLTPPAVGDRQPVHIRGGLDVTLGGRHWQIGPTRPEPGTEDPRQPGSFGHQVAWSMVARTASAFLQVLVLVLLARGLPPDRFALVITVNVALQVTVAVNGFGLLRQIEFRRSRDRGDPTLESLFALRLWFSYASAFGWVVLCLVMYAITGSEFSLAMLPAAVWLLVEQTTQVWNGVSVVDGHTVDLVGSYFTRRFPVVLFLLVALAADLPMIWAWTLGLAAGSFLSYAWGYRSQEAWARVMWPRRASMRERVPFDLGYWWGLVGVQLRDFDVAVVHAVDVAASGFYAFPARLVSPMNLVTAAAATSAFPKVARGGLTRRHLRLGLTLGLVPVTVVALVTALAAPLLPVILGEAYEGSVEVMRVACVTAVLSGAGTMVATMVQGHSTQAAREVGYLALGMALLQVVAAGVGAALDGAVLAAAMVAAVNGLAAAALLVLALRVSAR